MNDSANRPNEPSEPAAPQPDVERPERIGPYRILDVLGKGGMGVVYLAEQEAPFHRRVALKLIKLGMDTKEVIARFESERQALALMSHPNIAKVFDAGSTEQGRPYFVMELVAGIPITTYCDQHRLPVEERLALFVQACQAMQHAHQKGIIHRDIKASNVLVAVEDGTAVPKVIDFGVAKATNQRLTEHTLATQQGSFIGTPEYMSPEQAESSGLDVDTTTDVYSLGVLLYELVVGVVPFALRWSSYEEMLRTLRETDPPSLGTRFNSLGGEKASKMAARRHTDVRSLRRRLRGELDWIAQKAMEKDRTRRYQSAAELAADVNHYLKQETVLAGPPSAVYQFRKFAMRNKGPVAVVMTVIVLLAGFAVAMGVQANRIAQAAARANREAATAEQVSAFMVDMFEVSDPSEARGNTITAREILDTAAVRIESELAEQPEVQAQLMDTMGRVYRSLGLYEQSGSLLEQALELRERALGPEHLDVALSLNNLAILYRRQAQYALAEPLYLRALAIRERELDSEHPNVGQSLNNLANLYEDLGQYAEAEPLYLRALAIREKAPGSSHRDLAMTLNNLAILYRQQAEYAKAESLYLRALAIRETALGPDHPDVAQNLNNLGALYQTQGRHAEAVSFFLRALTVWEKALGPDHPNVGYPLINLGEVYAGQGKYAEAESRYQRARNIFEDQLGPEHPLVAYTLNGLANVYRDQDRLGEAEPLYERALAIREKLGAEHPNVATSLHDLAKLYAKQGNIPGAERAFQRALAIREDALGPDHPDVAKALEDYAALLHSLGRSEEAGELEARAQSIRAEGR